MQPDLDSPYLKNQLIAYIGNKRRLLGFLNDVFSELAARCTEAGESRGADSRHRRGPLRFGDCFAGSGSVSRLAKASGFSVASNDWELYSEIINNTHIRLSPEITDTLFNANGGLSGLLSELNSLEKPEKGGAYISRYYAPESTKNADYRYERLFYTRENALFIDAVRNRIEELYPGWELSGDDYMRKCALLAPLLYQAATHANTNGVFKACHKGFGGHGADALTRIMADMRLQLPLTITGEPDGRYTVERCDAADFASGRSFDICYLDPPYNQHQYGSNYFMLNTIARWDKPPVSMERTSDGRLEAKAGIRQDWNETRSGFCYAKTAPDELRRLLENIDARFIVLSYNTEGIIPFDELFDILEGFGKTEIFCRDYIIYRGGKQSLGRLNRNVEFQLVFSRHESPGKTDRGRVDRVLKVRSIISLMNESFVPERLQQRFRCSNGCVLLAAPSEAGGREITAETELYYRFSNIPETEVLSSLTDGVVKQLLTDLESCRCVDRQEEAHVLMDLIRNSDIDAGRYRKLWTILFNVVRKFTFRKYRDVFETVFNSLIHLAEEERAAGKPGKWKSVERGIAELQRVSDLRFHE